MGCEDHDEYTICELCESFHCQNVEDSPCQECPHHPKLKCRFVKRDKSKISCYDVSCRHHKSETQYDDEFLEWCTKVSPKRTVYFDRPIPDWCPIRDKWELD